MRKEVRLGLHAAFEVANDSCQLTTVLRDLIEVLAQGLHAKFRLPTVTCLSLLHE
jgi:hypothetical protein